MKKLMKYCGIVHIFCMIIATIVTFLASNKLAKEKKTKWWKELLPGYMFGFIVLFN